MTPAEIQAAAREMVKTHGADAVAKWYDSYLQDTPAPARVKALFREYADPARVFSAVFVEAARETERERIAWILQKALDDRAIDHGEQCIGDCKCYEDFAEAMMGVEQDIRNPKGDA